jgi:hypothetical protein
MIECKFEDKILTMSDDVKDIKKDVRSLLQFKFAITGIVAFVSVLATLIVTYFSK